MPTQNVYRMHTFQVHAPLIWPCPYTGLSTQLAYARLSAHSLRPRRAYVYVGTAARPATTPYPRPGVSAGCTCHSLPPSICLHLAKATSAKARMEGRLRLVGNPQLTAGTPYSRLKWGRCSAAQGPLRKLNTRRAPCHSRAMIADLQSTEGHRGEPDLTAAE